AHFDQAVPVPAGAMHQGGAGLDQPLPDQPLLRLPSIYRTPDGFQRLVRQPELALVEEVPGSPRLGFPGLRGQAAPMASRFRAPWQLETVPTTTDAGAPVSPARLTTAS